MQYVLNLFIVLEPNEWKNWGEWSECDADCDEGTRTRVRSCDGFYGEGECVGELIERANCSTNRTCPLCKRYVLYRPCFKFF